jgi:peptidoglycan/LPS O-acetylase OafA/YrhL
MLSLAHLDAIRGAEIDKIAAFIPAGGCPARKPRSACGGDPDVGERITVKRRSGIPSFSSRDCLPMHETMIKPAPGWIAPIDGLRAVAVFAVLIHHGNTPTFTNWALGNVGVALFFSISGFVAYYVLYRDEQKLGAINYNYFLFRRVLRIWPAYFTLIAIAWLIASLEQRAITFEFSTITFTYNWDAAAGRSQLSILWSIAVEEQFYVVAPLMYLCLRSRYWLLFSAAVVIAANIGRLIYIAHVGPAQGFGMGIYFVTYAYADTFLSGALVARWFLKGNKTTATKQWLGFLAGSTLLVVLIRLWAPILWPPYSALAPLPYAALPIACGAILFSILPYQRTTFSTILGSRPMHFFGTISFGLYMVHVLILTEIRRVDALQFAPGIVSNVIYISASITGAIVLYLLIERPFLRLKSSAGPKVGYWPQVLVWGTLLAGFARMAL